MNNDLQGKIILITGSSRGIGEATARRAKEYGATVVLHDREVSSELTALERELDSSSVIFDVADQAQVEHAIGELAAQGVVPNVLVNCAGITNANGFFEATDDEWLEVFKVNVLGTVHCCKAVVPLMKERGGGRIINISSIRGYATTSGRAAYSTSKAAIINLTASLAKEFAPTIAVNAIAPGFTNTEMSKGWSEQLWSSIRQSVAGRVAEPIEIAEAILFFASDRASFITGQTLLVDGGYSIAGK